MGGSFTSPKFRLLRLNADGTLDDTFNPSTSIPELRTIDLQADGKVLAGGAFTVRRLLTDGPADPTWTMGNVGSEMIEAVAAQPDGKVIIGGDFGEVNGVPGYSYLARLNSDGSLDTGFHPDLIASVQSVALQSDGKILAGGLLQQVGGVPRGGVARFNADGSADSVFNQGAGASAGVYDVGVQGDGKIVIGGSFSSYNGVNRSCVARLNTDGSLDSVFNTASIDSTVLSLTVQPDCKITIGGSFTTVGGVSRKRVARLNNE